MRILHLVTRFLAAGTERNIVGLVRWQRAQGHEVHLAVGRDSDEANLPGDIPIHRVAALVRPVRPHLDVLARWQINSLLVKSNFDVLHTHQSKAGVLGRHAARGKVRATLHTVHMSSFGPGYAPLASAVFKATERYCARFTDTIICVGLELRDSYLRASIGHRSQYRVIRSPIDVERFSAARTVTEPERAALREHFGVRPGARVAVAIGALETRKRQALIVGQLCALLRSGGLDLLIAGQGPELRALEQLGDLLAPNGLRLLGYVERIPELLSIADVLVHASTAEGVPQVVIQALAAGVPVVATDVIGLREVPGAPIHIVPADGAGVASAVEDVLAGPRPSPVPMKALESWQPSVVEAQLALMHNEVPELRQAGICD
jgi:glycosyltransferase involved in cell wall biosynthesis